MRTAYRIALMIWMMGLGFVSARAEDSLVIPVGPYTVTFNVQQSEEGGNDYLASSKELDGVEIPEKFYDMDLPTRGSVAAALWVYKERMRLIGKDQGLEAITRIATLSVPLKEVVREGQEVKLVLDLPDNPVYRVPEYLKANAERLKAGDTVSMDVMPGPEDRSLMLSLIYYEPGEAYR